MNKSLNLFSKKTKSLSRKKQKILIPIKKTKKKCDETLYSMYLHMFEEKEILSLLRVFYFWE